MTTRDRARDRGLRAASVIRAQVASELREARRSAGLSQHHVARVAGLSQTKVSRTERGQRRALTVDELAVHCAAVGLRLSMRAYPNGSPVRDVAQLRLLERLRPEVDERFTWRAEAPVGGRGDLRGWDVLLGGPVSVGIDAETRLQDIQALQRRTELKWRDSGVDRVVLLVAATHHNRLVMREQRQALASTFPLSSEVVLAAFRSGSDPGGNGILLL